MHMAYGASTTRHEGAARMMEVNSDRIVLRQSWLGTLAMCPERARQDMLGLSESSESTSTAIGTAVHYGIEQCLSETIRTQAPLSMEETVEASMEEWARKVPEIVRWNHSEKNAEEIVGKNTVAWWDEVRADVRPKAVEWFFELPLVVDQKPEIWLQGTVDCVQDDGLPIIDWKNPGRKPSSEWEKKRWSVQAAAYTWAAVKDGMATDPPGFEFVHLVKGDVHRTLVEYGPAEWASLVALARSAGTLISADLPVWPLNMTGWHCSPKWCGAWSTCRGRFAGPDPWNQL